MSRKKVRRYFEFRQGNGNEGNYYVCTLEARDIEHALGRIRYHGYINLNKYYRKILAYDYGDNSLDMWIHQERGCDFAEYTATLREITPEDAAYNLSRHGR